MDQETRQRLEEITRALGVDKTKFDELDRELKARRLEFFDTLNQFLESTARPIKVIGEDEEIPPGWRLKYESDGKRQIEEDPSWMRYSFINEIDGMVYQRSISQGAPELDDERLLRERPDVYERVTEIENLDTFIDLVEWALDWTDYDCDVCNWTKSNEAIADIVRKFAQANRLPRRVKPLEKLSSEDFNILQDYLIPGKLSARLLGPRPVKPEDYE